MDKGQERKNEWMKKTLDDKYVSEGEKRKMGRLEDVRIRQKMRCG